MREIEKPLVTVVLTAYNHEKYIGETLSSIFVQTYSNIQVIIIDNASTDGTVTVIEKMLPEGSSFILIRNLTNLGLCRAFNQGLSLARGKYIIDLAADDIMLPSRVEKQVEAFEKLGEEYGVVFTNARYMEADGKLLNFHYPVNHEEKAKRIIPSGDVYKSVLENYFICTPTMMMRTQMLANMSGYDESLYFEDFDFWVRSSVHFKYFYLDEVLTFKRNVPDSLSKQVYKKGNHLLETCYIVCNKAYDLNRDQEEFDLLAARIRTFIRKCFYAEEFELAVRFRRLLNYIENPGFATEMIVAMCRLHLPVNSLYRFYLNNLQKKPFYRKDLAF
ncbi:glycosyltransferase [Dyadobacter sp. CY345]|uniref:glycosyltransferase family 2 protein n=1 Tax=Dyadobacter sp. CY345 TaxID=2909335 RepID=UPI001F3434DA|nr:glycosyltransferase [Dyadobacter sp. CY345]MCF2443071.1 glycosyltransferase [Dyadobacter sp. CY345]